MATRNINTFIEHLMNEAMTAAGTAGGGKGGKGGDGNDGQGFDFPQYNNPDEDPRELQPGDPGTLSPGDPGYNDPGEGGQFPDDPYPNRGRTPLRLPGSRPFGPEDVPNFPGNIPGYNIQDWGDVLPFLFDKAMPPQFSPLRHYRRKK